MDFINTAEEDAECCLIHSNDGSNRCIAVAAAYLMVRYKWRLEKVFQLLDSKNIESKMSENYLSQLQGLEESLGTESVMSEGWGTKGLGEEELIITNTYLNSIEIPYKKVSEEPKGGRRVQWKDRI